MDRRRNEHGSALILVLVSSIILVAMVGSLALVSQRETEVVQDVRELEQARLITEAGLNLVVEDYQQDQVAPPSSWYSTPQDFGDGDFLVTSDRDLGVPEQRRYVQLQGNYGEATWRLEGIIGPVIKPLYSAAIQANGNIDLTNNPLVDSWDSTIAPGWYTAANAKKNGDIKGNANISMTNSTDVMGNVEVEGTVTQSINSTVSGEVTPEGDGPYLPSVDALVASMDAALAAANDNATIDPTMLDLSSGSPAIDVPMNQTKWLTAGDYYLNDLNVGQNAGLYFDTRSGPIRIVVHTDDYIIGRSGFTYVLGSNPVYVYMSGNNRFSMQERAFQWTDSGQAKYFQVAINSNVVLDARGDPMPRFDMGQYTQFEGTIMAPETGVELSQQAHVFGAIIADNVSIGQYSGVHYDEDLAEWQQLLIPDSYRIYYKRRVITG